MLYIYIHEEMLFWWQKLRVINVTTKIREHMYILIIKNQINFLF